MASRFGSDPCLLSMSLFEMGERPRLRDRCSHPPERQGAGFTVRMVVTVSPIEAEIWADTVPAVNMVVVAVKVPLV